MKLLWTILIIFVCSLFSSCTKSYVDDYNSSSTDIEASEKSLLVASEVALFACTNGEYARASAIFIQSMAGLNNWTLINYALYHLDEGSNQNEWNDVYTNWMETSNDLIKYSKDANPYYKGMGQILKAWAGGFISDLYGDTPFSEAMKEAENIHPKYDRQQKVYSLVQDLLSEGISNLNKKYEDNKVIPSDDDIMFKGDIQSWIKLAWVLKARYANRTSNKEATSADSTLSFLSKANIDNTFIAEAKFGSNFSNANSWAAFFFSTAKDLGLGEFFVNRLVANNDPRLEFYIAKNREGEFAGASANTNNSNRENASVLGVLYNRYEASIPLVSYEEAKFLEAEAYLRKNMKEESAIAFNEGVKASVVRITKSAVPTDFELNHASETGSSISLEKIILGKYDALFTSIEVWNDWRRTGFPFLTANEDIRAKGDGQIPQRFPTTLSERSFNNNAIVVSDVFKPVWFAKEE